MKESKRLDVKKSEIDEIDIVHEITSDLSGGHNNRNIMSVPIAKLSTLGAGVSSLIPALNTITQSTTMTTEGLYRLANAGVGDALKAAANGNFWGALKTADGASKFAQFQKADPISITTKTAAVNPVTVMMAVSLYSIEKQLDEIVRLQKQILSFLEIEKEAEIKADVETLLNLIKNYKYNWDNSQFITSNHKLILDIQRTARKNMNGYKIKINEVIKTKPLIIGQMQVQSSLRDLEKKFKYYRLSLYSYTLSLLLEIMLSGNFKEEYITGIKEEIIMLCKTYRELFNKSSIYLEKISNSSNETNMMKGFGDVSKAVGGFINRIPFVKEGQVDEFLQDSGDKLKNNAKSIEGKTMQEFANLSNPGTNVIIERLEDMIKIYNHTDKIFFDDKMIYLFCQK